MTLKESLLWPFTLLYGAVVHLRARAYRKGILKQRRLDGMVISVGNLTVGGTGKTPMVLWIAEKLVSEGKRVGILTRGYRGEPAATDTKESAAAESTSDEVKLLRARLGDRVAFGVGADRFARGEKLARRGVQWFILDDGFQHLKLSRDVDIVLIDAMDPFGGGHLLPAGRLREGRSALSRADVIVITRSRHAPAIEAAVRRDTDAPIFYARPQLDSIRSVESEFVSEEDPRERTNKLFVFCGIGNPSAFVADLRDWGFHIVGHKFYPDHYRYTQQDVRSIETEARTAGASDVICTEKDIFNLLSVEWQKSHVWYSRISMQIDGAEDFWRLVMNMAESRSRVLQ